MITLIMINYCFFKVSVTIKINDIVMCADVVNLLLHACIQTCSSSKNYKDCKKNYNCILSIFSVESKSHSEYDDCIINVNI